MHAHPDPWAKGIINIDENNKVLGFVEKPSKEDLLSGKYKGESASLAYVFEPEILNYINFGFEDLGKDVFPRMLKNDCKMYAINPEAYVCDIGTLEKDFPESILSRNTADNLPGPRLAAVTTRRMVPSLLLQILGSNAIGGEPGVHQLNE